MKLISTKLLFSSALFLVFCNQNFAQNASVEKSTSGIQVGLLGAWIHKEIKLANEIALRGEVGLNGGIWGGSFYPKTGYLFTPVLTIEPRWYYNLEKRQSKTKNIAGNSGNFLTIQSSFHPNWFTISNYSNVEIANQVSIIPTWGIKRNIGNHLTYETGIGIGVRYIFAKSSGYVNNVSETAANLHLRIGYRF